MGVWGVSTLVKVRPRMRDEGAGRGGAGFIPYMGNLGLEVEVLLVGWGL